MGKVTTAVLSITNKQKKKEAEKKKGKDGDEKMDVDSEKKDEKKEKMEVDEKKEEEKPEEGKYRPMKDISIGGIVMLDRAELGSGEEEQIVEPMEVNKGASSTTEEEGEEPSPPEPFQWTED